MYIYISICMHIHIYIHICIYIVYIHTHIDIYIYRLILLLLLHKKQSRSVAGSSIYSKVARFEVSVCHQKIISFNNSAAWLKFLLMQLAVDLRLK